MTLLDSTGLDIAARPDRAHPRGVTPRGVGKLRPTAFGAPHSQRANLPTDGKWFQVPPQPEPPRWAARHSWTRRATEAPMIDPGRPLIRDLLVLLAAEARRHDGSVRIEH